MARPETHYARTDDGAHIAYQVVGDGPVDLLFVPWWWNHLETQWDDPRFPTSSTGWPALRASSSLTCGASACRIRLRSASFQLWSVG